VSKTPAHVLARQAEYRREHPEINMAADARRRFGESVPASVFAEVMKGPCFGCGKQPAMGVDHIIPKNEGGRNIESNLRPGCRVCNHRKGRRI
jgi:5-methylcytosine-specific restriction endonuclease McrA